MLGPFWEKLGVVCDLTKTHAWNLARFVAIYKGVLVFLRRALRGESEWHSFLAGCIGGGLIFSADNSIVLYLLSRVLTGLVKLGYERITTPNPHQLSYGGTKIPSQHGFAIEATLVWGFVMYLFRHHRHTLQSSLQSSMQYLYNDSDHWKDIWTLLVHNK
ncbi:hypothetical protein PSACC_01576 [Paramicrosporidium saccamoebae]|uniref:Peroxisomal membrane protein 4 n=1 Tax=Paramicrosporidium saccamoebae TaxID=1246581 RepID=A0A2H9TLK1_9FUNG|nr:hypothetical protein PSACC_01576 [Paramicrosporidium saccamoebae]